MMGEVQAVEGMAGMPQGLAQVMNLGNLLTQTASKYPSHPGLIQCDKTHTWRQINARVDALAQHLKTQGIKPGDRVLVQMTNGLPLLESGWACFKLGAVWVPVNYRLTPVEVAYIAKSSGAVPRKANTPAESCMRSDTSPKWCSMSPKVISICVSRLK